MSALGGDRCHQARPRAPAGCVRRLSRRLPRRYHPAAHRARGTPVMDRDLFGNVSTHDDPGRIADAAVRAIRAVAGRLPEFTTDEVAAELTDWTIAEPRLLGPA